MHTLLLMTVLGFIAVTVGLFGLYINATIRLNEIERDLKAQRGEITRHKREIKTIKDHANAEPDKVVIVHEYEDNGVKFPSKGGF